MSPADGHSLLLFRRCLLTVRTWGILGPLAYVLVVAFALVILLCMVSTTGKFHVGKVHVVSSRTRHTDVSVPEVPEHMTAAPEARSVPMDASLFEAVNRMIQPPMKEVFSCSKLFSGEEEEIRRATLFQKSCPYTPPSFSAIMQSTTSCEVFRKARGYHFQTSNLEKSFPLAFTVLVHKSAEQFERLLRAIYRPMNYYCVHVDKKATPYIQKAVQAIVRCFDNVFLASRQEIVVYAGFTRLQADINCMRDLLHCCKDWKYLLNMAGSEFPLRPNHHLVQILKLYNGTNIVERHKRTNSPWRYERKFKTVIKSAKRGRLIKESEVNDPAPFNLNVTKCSAYGAFSREFIDFALHNTVAQALLNWTKTTYSPDELFWGTLNNLHGNPQLATPGGDFSNEDNHMARAVMWKSPECHGKNVHIICNFGAGDLPWLGRSYQLVANKFDLQVDQVAYGCMEELLALRQRQEHPQKVKPFETYLNKARGKRN